MNVNKKTHYLAVLALSVTLTSPAFADNDSDKHRSKDDRHEWKSEKHHSKEYKHEKHRSESRDDDHGRRDEHSYRDKHGQRLKHNDYFRDSHRAALHEYYDREFRAGHCPPGLVKKHNGCLPPGQANRWRVGRPLAQEIQYYPLPPAVVGYLGQPPAGYQYVRVDDDVLLLATGTRLVIDAIRNLGF